MPRLIFVEAEFEPRCCELKEGKVSVGRVESNDLVIVDGSVSAAHCEIHVNGPEVIVRDSGSRNGTFVNDKRVWAQLPVKHGEVIRFANVAARLELDAPEETCESSTPEFRRLLKEQLRREERGWPLIVRRPTPQSTKESERVRDRP